VRAFRPGGKVVDGVVEVLLNALQEFIRLIVRKDLNFDIA
jgi:hypothetical protein